MKVLEGLNDAGGVEPGGAVVEITTIPQNGPQFTAQTRLHQHVQILSVLESLKQANNERTIRFFHDLLFGHDVLLLPRLHDLILLHLLQRERPLFSIAGDLDEFNAAESADAQSGDDAQVLQLQRLELLVDALN